MNLVQSNFKNISRPVLDKKPYIYIRKYARCPKLVFNSFFVQKTDLKDYTQVQLSVNDTDLVLGFTFCNVDIKGIKTRHKLTISKNEVSISAAFLLSEYSFILPGVYTPYVVNKDFKSSILEVTNTLDLSIIKPDDRFYFITFKKGENNGKQAKNRHK